MRRGNFYCPTAHAVELGLHIIEHPLPNGASARYFPDEGTIVIRPDLDLGMRRSAVAHELQHHLRGDARCGGSGDTGPAEMATRVATARALLTIPGMALARWDHGDDIEALARSQMVAPQVVQDWLDYVAPARGDINAA